MKAHVKVLVSGQLNRSLEQHIHCMIMYSIVKKVHEK